MEEFEKFTIEPERIEEVLYPACRKVSDLTKDRLMTIAIRERLSVQGYVKKVSIFFHLSFDQVISFPATFLFLFFYDMVFHIQLTSLLYVHKKLQMHWQEMQ